MRFTGFHWVVGALLILLSWSSCDTATTSPPTTSTPTMNTAQTTVVPPAAASSPTSLFKVTSVDMSVTPGTLSPWKCGAYIQVVYTATFHVTPGPGGGIMAFSWTVNNGRGQTNEKLTIIPGQSKSDYVFTWQGALPADHTVPGPGGVLVSSPNKLISKMVWPAGGCR